MSYQRQVCLVLLVGIPGSGKSFFRRFFEGYLETNFHSFLGSVQVSSVCYDNYSKVRWPQKLMDGDCWRNKRLEVIKDVEQMIVNFQENNCERISLNNTDRPSCANKIQVNNPGHLIILIDDNMYYRSMRYDYLKLSRALNISFCQIYFDVAVKDAIHHNKLRSLDEQVPDYVIQDMFVKIEPPLATNFWETNSITVPSYIDYGNSEVLSDILTCIKNALETPFQNEVTCCKMKEESRQITQCNVIHQVDNVLKQLIGPLIKSEIKKRNGCDPKLVSKYYSNKRLEVLKQIKDGSIPTTIEITQPIDAHLYLIKPVLLNLLRNK